MQVARLLNHKHLFLTLGILLALLSVFLLSGSVAAQEGVIEIDTSPDIVPVLSVIHNNTLLQVVADDNNLNARSWQNAGPLTYEPDCEFDNLDYGSASATNAQIVLTESNNGSWYCFKVADADDNVGYAKYRVMDVVIVIEEPVTTTPLEEPADMPEPVAAPSVSVEQMDNVLQASTSVELVNPAWQVLIVTNTTDCSSAAFERAHSAQIGQSSRVSGLAGNDNGKLYCFRVSDSGLSHGYGLIQVAGLAVAAPAPQSPPVAASDNQDSDDPDADNQDDDKEMDDDDTQKDDDDDDAAGNKDGDDEDINLRWIGGGIVVVGVLALIGVLVFTKKQPDSVDDEDDDAEDKK